MLPVWFILSLPVGYIRTICTTHGAVWAMENLSIGADELWQTFKTTARKEYAEPTIEDARKRIFENNMLFIEDFNKRESAQRGYTLGSNYFADMSPEEFRDSYFGFGGSPTRSEVETPVATSRHVASTTQVPKFIDWTRKGVVSPVLRQGKCGACWAVSAAGSLEGQVARHLGGHEALSIQEFIDCSSSNSGCSGGYPDVALMDLKKIGGIDTRDAYSYSGKKGECKYSKRRNDFEVDDVLVVAPDEKLLQKAVAEIGPISVALDSSPKSFMFYKNGIFFSPECNTDNISHAVLLVGYGSEDGRDYWLIKNSWGTHWGQEGYIKLARNRGNHCGVAAYAIFPKVKKIR